MTGRVGRATAPALRATILFLVVPWALTACGGGGGGGNNTPAPVPARVTVSGTASFEFPPPNAACDGLDFAGLQVRPIRGATVELVNAANNSRIDATSTDASGFYSLSGAANTEVFVRVRAELIQSGSPSWDVQVRNNTSNTSVPLNQRPLYLLDSARFNSGTADTTRNLLAASGWDGAQFSGPRSAAPFSVLDIAYKMMQRIVVEGDPGANFPPLDVFWSPNNRTSAGSGNTLADLDAGNIGTTFYIGGSIGSMFLLGEDQVDVDEFDDHVVAHEWGHYFEDRFSRSDSIGGQHSFGDRLDMRLAFGEGFGNAVSAIGLDDPLYCDTLWSGGALRGFGYDLETVASGLPGWFNEFSISALLYDLWDTAPDGVDTSSIGFGPMYDVLIGPQRTGPAFTSAFTFFAALKAQPNADIALIDDLLNRELITAAGIDPFALSETNDAGGRPDVLPVYTDLVMGTPRQVCANSQFDSGRFGNKLAEFRYLRFDLAAPGPVTITIDTVNPPSQPSAGFDCTASQADPENSTHSDPDIQVWRNGQLVAEGLGCEPNQEVTTTASLPVGTYLMDLNEVRHIDPATNTPGGFPQQICFDVTIAP